MAQDLEKTLSPVADEELGTVAGGMFDFTFAPVVSPVYAAADHGGVASAFIGGGNTVGQTYNKQDLNAILNTWTGNSLALPVPVKI